MAAVCQAPVAAHLLERKVVPGGGPELAEQAKATSPSRSEGGSSSSSHAPGGMSAGEIEGCVIAAVRKVLDGRAIGRFENFFAAGLHSVSAARVRSELSLLLATPLPVAALYQQPCAAHLAALIYALRTGRLSSEVEDCSSRPAENGALAGAGGQAQASAQARVAGALAEARLLLSVGGAGSLRGAARACRRGLAALAEAGRWPPEAAEGARQLQLLAAGLRARPACAGGCGQAAEGCEDSAAAQLDWPCCGGGAAAEAQEEEEEEEEEEDVAEALGGALRLCGGGEGAAEAAAVLATWASLRRPAAGGAAAESLRARHVAAARAALVGASTGWGRGAGALRLAGGRLALPAPPPAFLSVGSLRPATLLTVELEELGLQRLQPELCLLPVNLRTLNVSHNQLSELPAEIGKLAALRTLDLSANSLAFLPDEVSELPSLTALSIAGNRIRNAVGEASGCLRLVSLDASVQSLAASGVSAETRQRARRVRAGVAPRSGALETLEVSFSGLAEGPHLEVGCGASLRYYLCIGNNLEKCPDLKRCPGLTSLSLGQNQLRALPPKLLQGLPELRWLSLEANRLPKLPPAVGALRHLRHLMLQGNRLEHLPEEISSCTQLRVLEVQHNRLTALPKALASLRILQFFYAHGNALSDAAAVFALLRSVASLKIVGLGGNLLDLSGLAPADRLLPGARLGVGWNRGADGKGPAPPQPTLGTPLLTELLSCGEAWHFDPAVRGRRGAVLAVCFMAQGAPTAQWVGQIQACRAGLLAVDALYVCDPANAWYLQDPARTWRGVEHFAELVRGHASAYGSRVLMLGSSMGATACLLFAELAGLVMAFSPQVELRAGQGRYLDPELLDRFEGRVQASLRACQGRVVVHVGRRHHADALAARRLAAKAPEVVHVAYHETEQHNTTKYLHERRGQLTGMVRLAVAQLQIAGAVG